MPGLRVSDDELRTLLVRRLELMSDADFDRARRTAARLKVPLETTLVERARIPQGFLLEQLTQAWGIGFIDLKPADVTVEALRLVPEEFARTHVVAAFDRADRNVSVAMLDPRDRRVLAEVETLTRLKPTPFLAPESAIRRAHLLYRADVREMLRRSSHDEPAVVAATAGEDVSAPDTLTRILAYAAVVRASDIHIEPYEREVLVRYRVDGVLTEALALPTNALASLVARIKILAGMRIDERRAPQDGRFHADLGGFKLDLRVSSLPTHWGEKIVIRVLEPEVVMIDLEDLGLAAADYEVVLRNLMRPFGMILVTGPTGAGKSTTLYSMLVRLGVERHNAVNISTIEDPVEQTLPRVNQVSLNPAAGVEFATGLRALLRQDPDIIMLGEIRDRETAEIAMRSALVGRLLLSTLHTNDSTGAIPRLIDMGVEPFLLASTLSLVIAQRLVRRICVTCRESVVPEAGVLKILRDRPDFEQTIAALRGAGVLGQGADPLAGVRLFCGKGCLQCNGTGFRGRLGVYELFEVDETARRLIMERQSGAHVRATAVSRGMKTMFQDGLAKVLLGETTLEEVVRVAL